MSLITLVSAKGSPGVTTAAVALGATWPEDRQVLIIESDPAGGDLTHRFGLTADPGLVSLAAASRRETTSIDEHLQVLPGGLRALVGPVSAEQASAALSMLVQSSMFVTASGDLDMIADCGRTDAASPALALIAQADMVVVVARSIVTDVAHVAATLPLLRTHTENIALLVTGKGSHQPDEVAAAVGLPLIGTLADDSSGADVLCGERGSGRSLGRSPLLRSARHAVNALVGLISPTELSEAS